MGKIVIKNLSKSFKNNNTLPTIVLKNCNLEIGANEAVGLLGLNGSGKTTLMKILAGAEELSSGKKIIQGNISWPVGIYSGLVNNISVSQNIFLIANLLNIKQEGLLDRVLSDKILNSSKEKLVMHLSSGMRARLGLVLATSIDFDFFLFDELSAVGDKFFRKLFYEKLQEIKLDRSVIMTSHHDKIIERYCDYAYIIRNKTLSKKYPVDEAIKIFNEV